MSHRLLLYCLDCLAALSASRMSDSLLGMDTGGAQDTIQDQSDNIQMKHSHACMPERASKARKTGWQQYPWTLTLASSSPQRQGTGFIWIHPSFTQVVVIPANPAPTLFVTFHLCCSLVVCSCALTMSVALPVAIPVQSCSKFRLHPCPRALGLHLHLHLLILIDPLCSSLRVGLTHSRKDLTSFTFDVTKPDVPGWHLSVDHQTQDVFDWSIGTAPSV